MTLRRKILIYIGMTTFLLFLLLYIISERTLLRNYEMMELNQSQEGMKRILLSLSGEYNDLSAMTINYAGFDDIYEFALRPTVPDNNDPYIQSNYPDSLYVSSRINFTVVLNNQKEIYFAKAFDYANNRALPYPSRFINSLLHEHASFLEHPDPASRKSGLLVVDKQPIIVISFPILTSNNKGPVHGTLIFARIMDNNFTKHLSERADMPITLSPVDPSFALPRDVTAITSTGNRKFPFWTESSNTTINSSILLSDIDHKPAAVLQFAQPRELYKQAKKDIAFYLLYFCLSGIAFFILVRYVLQRTIFTRLNHVINRMNTIESGKDFSIRIPESGKDEFSKLEKSFNHMMTTLEHVQTAVQFQADHDALTGLTNRKALFTYLDYTVQQSHLHQSRFALFFIDLDRFKLINDTLGHHMGDQLLLAVAVRLRHCIQKGDYLYRLGGDEFCIISHNIVDSIEIENLARMIKETLEAPFNLEGHKVTISASIGISLYPEHGANSELLLQHSDAAMLDVKENGKDNYRWYTDSIETHRKRKTLIELSLKQAIKNEELLLYYQPKWDLASKRIVGMEALLRWNCPQIGEVSPNEFIPIAESSGMINEIGEWVMRSACRQFVSWQNQFPDMSLTIAINISGVQLLQPSFMDQIRHVFNEEKVDPHNFELEVTESFAIQKFDEVIDVLYELRSMGFMISIDDFGAGYSSMKYLISLPIQCMKIDKTLIDQLKDNVRNQVVVSALIDLGHRLQLTIVAEGVESEEQLLFLQSAHCDQIQGFLISKPLPANQAFELIMPHLAPLDK
jgi:diguanylate cyclase (GGDEF)-like protein